MTTSEYSMGGENRENIPLSQELPNRRFVTLPSELPTPEDQLKFTNARRLVRSTFPESVLGDETHRDLVEATIDIMATTLLSTGISFGEGDAPENKLGKFYRADSGSLDSIPIMYHNKIGTWEAMLGAKFVNERQQNLDIKERLMLGLVSAGDDLVFGFERGEDELRSADTVAAMMRHALVFDDDMIEGVKACIISSIFIDGEGQIGAVEEALCKIRGINDSAEFPIEEHPFLDSLNKIHNTASDGDLLGLATRDAVQHVILHEIESLWRVVTPEERVAIVERSMNYFRDKEIASEDLTIGDIIAFIDENVDYREALGRRLQRNATWVRSHEYKDNSLENDLRVRKGINADFQDALGANIIGGMSVVDAFAAAMDYAGPESLRQTSLLLTPPTDIREEVNGVVLPTWRELLV